MYENKAVASGIKLLKIGKRMKKVFLAKPVNPARTLPQLLERVLNVSLGERSPSAIEPPALG